MSIKLLKKKNSNTVMLKREMGGENCMKSTEGSRNGESRSEGSQRIIRQTPDICSITGFLAFPEF